MVRWLLFLSLLIPMVSFSQMASIELPSRDVAIPDTRDSLVDRWNESQSGFNYLSSQAREFLYWINYCRRNPEGFWEKVINPNLHTFPDLDGKEAKTLKEDLLRAGPLPMFSLNRALIKTAQLHASDISDKKAAPSHTSTDGTDFGTRIKKAGIRQCANENISVGSQGSLLAVLLLYLDIGLPNLGHRKALLNPTLVETGVGTAPYGNGQFFLVQDLSCAQQ